MRKYIILFVLILCTLLSSCAEPVPKGYEKENVGEIEIFYKRYSMRYPYEWKEKNFSLSKEQKDKIYEELSKLEFKKTDRKLSYNGEHTSLDQVVLLFWNSDLEGLYYYFIDGKVYYKKHLKDDVYVAEDETALVSQLRLWTVERFPELDGEFKAE